MPYWHPKEMRHAEHGSVEPHFDPPCVCSITIFRYFNQFNRIMSVKVNSTIFVGGGTLLKVTHDSKVLKLPANFNIFLPPAALGNSPKKVPVLFYLCNFHPPLVDLKLMWDSAGLTCTADNCSEKGGFFNHAAKAGIAMVLPDTSPRA